MKRGGARRRITVGYQRQRILNDFWKLGPSHPGYVHDWKEWWESHKNLTKREIREEFARLAGERTE